MKYSLLTLFIIFEFGNYILVKGKSDDEIKKEMNSYMMKYLEDFTAVKKTKDQQTASDLDIIQQLMVQSWIKLLGPSKEQINQFLPEHIKMESNVENVENKIISDLKKKGQTRVAEAVLRYHHTNEEIVLNDLIAKKELVGLVIKEEGTKEILKNDLVKAIHLIADRMYLQSYLFDFVDDRDGSQFTVGPKEKTPGWSLDSLVLNTADYSETDWKKYFMVQEITLEESAKTGSVSGQDLSDEEGKGTFNAMINRYLTRFVEIKKSQDKETAADMDIIQQMVVQSWINLLQPTMEQIREFLPKDLEKEKNLDSVKTKITQAVKNKGQTPVSEAVLRYLHTIEEKVYDEILASERQKLYAYELNEYELRIATRNSPMIKLHSTAKKMFLQSYLFDFVDQPFTGQTFKVGPENKSSDWKLPDSVFRTETYNESNWQKLFGIYS